MRSIVFSDWAVSGTPFDSHDLRLLSMAAARRRFLDAEFDEHASRNASGSSFFRSIALIVSSCCLFNCLIVENKCGMFSLQLMALLLLKHAVLVNDGEGEDDASAVFVVCGIILWVVLVFHLFICLLSFKQVFLLRAASFVLPCYIMAWVIGILQRLRESQMVDIFFLL